MSKQLYVMLALFALASGLVLAADIPETEATTGNMTVDGTTGTWDEVKASISDGSRITLQSDVVMTEKISIQETNLILDLNGHTLTFDNIGGAYGLGTSAQGGMTIMDSSYGKTGKIYTEDNILLINNWGSVILDGITMERKPADTIDRGMIQNVGTLVLNNNVIMNDQQPTYVDTILNFNSLTVNSAKITTSSAIYNGYVSNPGYNVSCVINDVDIVSTGYGVSVIGKGVTNGEVDNNSVVLVINGGSIVSEGQGIGTNASGGAYAGHTITIKGGYIRGDDAGIYASSYGVYDIKGGTVEGEQALRIAAGILNVSGDAVIISYNESHYQDGVAAGGSGGAPGALVVGKAGSGYWGDLKVSVTGGNIINEAGDAIVISDAHMGESGFQSNTLEFQMTGGNIIGDIQTVTCKTVGLNGNQVSPEGTEPANGNAKIYLDGGNIAGDIKQHSKGFETNLRGTTVEGNVVQDTDTAKPVNISGGAITGEVPAGTTVTTHLLTYDYLSGSFKFYGNTVTLSADVPRARENYTFLGISFYPNATTASYQPGQTVTGISGDVTAYAVWSYDGPMFFPFPQDDEFIPPMAVAVQEEKDDSTEIACVAAGAVAAVLAIILVATSRGKL